MTSPFCLDLIEFMKAPLPLHSLRHGLFKLGQFSSVLFHRSA